MSVHQHDLIIDQLLSDPMTLAVMKADRVDPVSFKAMLRLHAERLAGTPRHGTSRFSNSGSPAFTGGETCLDHCRAP